MRTIFFVGALSALYSYSRAVELEAESTQPPELEAFAGPLAEDNILSLAQTHSHSHGHNHLDAWGESEGDSDAEADGDLDADEDVGDVAMMAMAKARKQKAAAAAAAKKKAAAPTKAKTPSTMGGVVDIALANKDKLRNLKAAK